MALFQLPTRRLICFDFVSIILFFFSDHLTKNGYIRSSMGLMHPMVLTLGWFRYKQGTMLNITGTVYIKRQQALSYPLALVQKLIIRCMFQVLYMWFDKFLLSVESHDLSQADKILLRVSSFPKLSKGRQNFFFRLSTTKA